jgi:hypothetical protein
MAMTMPRKRLISGTTDAFHGLSQGGSKTVDRSRHYRQ